MKAMTTIFYEKLIRHAIEPASVQTFTVNEIEGSFQFALDEMNLTGNSFGSKGVPSRSTKLFRNREEAIVHAEQQVRKCLSEGFDYHAKTEDLIATNSGDARWIEQLDDQIAHSDDANTKARLEQQRSSHIDSIACKELQIEYRANRNEWQGRVLANQ